MRAPIRAAVELLVAVAAATGCVLLWNAARSTIEVAPVLENEPANTSVIYSGPLIGLSLILATLAGVLTVVAVARLLRRAP